MNSNVKNKLRLAATLALCTGFGGPVSAQGTAPPAGDAASAGLNAPLMAATSVKQFIEALPEWNAANPAKEDKPAKQGNPRVTKGKDPSGRAAKVTRTHVSLADTPQEVVTCQPVNGFWLGALIEGKGLGLGLGSMREISVPVTKRAPLLVTAFGHSVQVLRPSSSTTEAAIDRLISMAGDNTGGERALDIVDDQNESQVAHSLGLEVSFLPAEVKASFSTSHDSSTHTAIAKFTETAFTVKLDLQDRSAKKSFFNDNFDVDSAKKLVRRGEIGMDNLPTFINSISYGRVVIFKLTSTETSDDMKVDLGGGGKLPNGVGVGGNVGNDEKKKHLQVTVSAVAFGGPEGSDKALTPETVDLPNVFGIMNKYLQEDAPLSSMVPISYTLNSLRDPTELASVQVTTDYTVTTYTPDAVGEQYKIKVWVIADKTGLSGSPYDVYGTLMVNSDVWWKRDEDNTVRWAQGQPLSVSEDGDFVQAAAGGFTVQQMYKDPPAKYHLHLTLNQHASGLGNLFGDYSLGTYDVDLNNLKAMSEKPNGQEFRLSWNDGGGHDAATLHVAVARDKYL